MPNLDFYAARPDLDAVLAFVLGAAGCEVFESYSVPGKGLRRFKTLQDVLEVFDGARSQSVELMLYSPSMRGRYRISRIDLKPKALAATPWRETIEGWGLIQLSLRGVREGALPPSHTNHNTEVRALKWEPSYPHFPPLAEWDFTEVTRVSRRINTYIRDTLAVARSGSRPILAGAQALIQGGAVTLRAV